MSYDSCQDLVHDYVDLFIDRDIFQIISLLEQTLDCSSLLWIWASHNSVLIGMMLGGLGLGAVRRGMRKKKGRSSKLKKNFGKNSRKNSEKKSEKSSNSLYS